MGRDSVGPAGDSSGGGGDGSGAFGALLKQSTALDRGLFIYGDDTDPSWHLRGVEREVGEDAVRASLAYVGAGTGNSLAVTFGDLNRRDRAFQYILGSRHEPETVNGYRITNTQHPDPSARKAEVGWGDDVTFRAVVAGAAGNSQQVTTQAGTPAIDAAAAAIAITERGTTPREILSVTFPNGATHNGTRIVTRAPAAGVAASTVARIDATSGNIKDIRLTYYQAGHAGNGFQVVFTNSAQASDNTVVATYASATRLNVVVPQGSVRFDAVIAAINAARHNATQLVTAAIVPGDPRTHSDAGGATSGNSLPSDPLTATLAGGYSPGAVAATATINGNQPGNPVHNIDFEAVVPGAAGNNIQVTIRRLATLASGTVTATYNSATHLFVNINGLVLRTAAVAAVNAARFEGRQIVRATAPAGTVQIGWADNSLANNGARTASLTGGVDGTAEAVGAGTWDAPTKTLTIVVSQDQSDLTTADELRGFINAVSAFPGTAAAPLAPNANLIPGATNSNSPNNAWTAAGGRDAAARTPLAVAATDGTNNHMIVRGVLANVDTIANVRTLLAANSGLAAKFEIVGTGTDFFRTSQSLASALALVGGRDELTRQPTRVRYTQAGRYTLEYYGDDSPAAHRSTLTEIENAWEDVRAANGSPGSSAGIRSPVATVTGSGAAKVDGTIPASPSGGNNYVPPSPVELLLRDETEGKFIEVRYHADHDTLQDVLDASVDGHKAFAFLPLAAGPVVSSTIGIPVTARQGGARWNDFFIILEADDITPPVAVTGVLRGERQGIQVVVNRGAAVAHTAIRDAINAYRLDGDQVLVADDPRQYGGGAAGTTTRDYSGTPAGNEILEVVLEFGADPSDTDAKVIALYGTNLAVVPEEPPFNRRMYPEAGNTEASGLNQGQVDDRVRALVDDWAEQGNTDQIPAAKIPATGGGLTEPQVQALINTAIANLRGNVAASMDTLAELAAAIAAIQPGATWLAPSANAPSGGADGNWAVRTGSTDPGIYYRSGGNWNRVVAPGTGGGTSYVLPQATEDTLGGVQGASATQAAASSGTTVLGWSVTRLRAAIGAAVRNASSSVRGIVLLGRAEDVAATETDTSRVTTIANVKALIARLAPAYVLPAATESALGGVRNVSTTEAGQTNGAVFRAWSGAMIAKLVTLLWIAPNQAEAEAGTATVNRLWTALRVRQAINAVVPAVFRTGNDDRIGVAKLGTGTPAANTALFGDGAWKTFNQGVRLDVMAIRYQSAQQAAVAGISLGDDITVGSDTAPLIYGWTDEDDRVLNLFFVAGRISLPSGNPSVSVGGTTIANLVDASRETVRGNVDADGEWWMVQNLPASQALLTELDDVIRQIAPSDWEDFAGTVPLNKLPAAVALDSEIADSVTGLAFAGNVLTGSRRSGSNPIEVNLSALAAAASGKGLDQIGFWRNPTTQADGNFVRTGIILPTNPADDKLYIASARWSFGDGYAPINFTLTGRDIKAIPTVAVGASTGGRSLAAEADSNTRLYGGKLASGELLLRNDNDSWTASDDYFVLFDPDGEAPEGGYLFYDRRNLSPADVTSATAVPATGLLFNLMPATSIPGRIYPDVDFSTELFGRVSIDGTWDSNQIRNYRLTLRTTHTFNGKSIVHNNPTVIPANKSADVPLAFHRFDSISSVSVGTYRPPGGNSDGSDDIAITEADLRGPTTIKYDLLLEGLNNNGVARDGMTLNGLTFSRVQVRSYQIGNAEVEPAPPVRPSISTFALDGDLSPAAGAINEQYTATWAVAQSSHLSALRIVRFSGTAAAPTSVTVITNINAAAFHGGTHALTVTGFNLAAGATETVRLEGYGEGQTPGTDQPVTYHDVRITAHAPATAATRFIRVPRQVGSPAARPTAATLVAALGATGAGVISTGTSPIGDWEVSGIPNTGQWLVGWIYAQSGAQPSHFTQAGIRIDNVVADRFAFSQNSVDYWVRLFEDTNYVEDEYNGATITVT